MGIVVSTPPVSEPITTAEAKLHLNLDDSSCDSSLVSSLIIAARRWCEERLCQQFVTATITLTLDHFPCREGGLIEFPRSPLISVDAASPIVSVKYYDSSNVQQTLIASKYDYDLTSKPGRLRPSYGNYWPTTYSRMGAVEIKYTAGYGAAAAVPQTIKQAILLLVGHWYANREPIGTVGKQIEFTVDSLLGVEWDGSVSYAGVT